MTDGCGRWKAMAGAATVSAQSRRQIIGIVPDWRSVAAADVAARHGVAMAVDIGALAGGRIVIRRQVAGLGKDTPVKVGDSVHVGRVIQIDNTMAVKTGQAGVQSFAGTDMGSMGADLGIGIGGVFGWERGAVVRSSCRYRTGSRAAVALTALIRG